MGSPRRPRSGSLELNLLRFAWGNDRAAEREAQLDLLAKLHEVENQIAELKETMGAIAETVQTVVSLLERAFPKPPP